LPRTARPTSAVRSWRGLVRERRGRESGGLTVRRGVVIASGLEPLVNVLEAVPNVSADPEAGRSRVSGAPSVDRWERHPEERSQFVGTKKKCVPDGATAVREHRRFVHWGAPPATRRAAAARGDRTRLIMRRTLPADLLVAAMRKGPAARDNAWEVTPGNPPTTRSASLRGPGADQSHLATTNSGRSRPVGRDLQGCICLVVGGMEARSWL
jgi:hypothetical protein